MGAEFDRQFDRQMMRNCLDLARRAQGQTAPNPLVGSIVVAEGEIVGEGFHPKAGEPHAEVFALRDAGDRAKGATIYVNLEPCNHYGRTPPCTEALIQAQVSRVVVGMVDPNPIVAGRGIDRLRKAGMEVEVGVEEAACQALNAAFVHRVRHQKPLGILKYAMTIDGKIAASSGHSAWVTSSASRAIVHQLRAECDAIIVGGNTVRRDNPLLTSHGVGHNPLRVVMSRSLNLPTEAQLWQVDRVPTVVFTIARTQPEMQQLLKQQGVEVVELLDLTPAAVMANLFDRSLSCVLWECGGTLAARAIADGSIQKVMAFIAPKIIGGAIAPSPVGDLGFERMTDALKLVNVEWRSIESDLLVTGDLEAIAPDAKSAD